MMDASGRANEVVESIRGLFKTSAHQMTPIEINRLVRQVRLKTTCMFRE
jgi:hypothetical protein